MCCLRDYYWTAIIPRIIPYYDYILVPIYILLNETQYTYYILHSHFMYIVVGACIELEREGRAEQ